MPFLKDFTTWTSVKSSFFKFYTSNVLTKQTQTKIYKVKLLYCYYSFLSFNVLYFSSFSLFYWDCCTKQIQKKTTIDYYFPSMFNRNRQFYGFNNIKMISHYIIIIGSLHKFFDFHFVCDFTNAHLKLLILYSITHYISTRWKKLKMKPKNCHSYSQ